MQKIIIIVLLVLNLYSSNKIDDNSSLNRSGSFHKFNVKKAQEVTYEVRVIKRDGTAGSGTAIALSSSGKLVTAYHNIDSYKSIVVIDNKGNKYKAKVGHISIDNDLAYLYINTKNKPFVHFAKSIQLGDDIYILSYENILLKGIISQNNPDDVMINVEAKEGTSGGGVFNTKNELVAILLRKDYLNKTSYAIKTAMFHKITQNFLSKKKLLNFNSKNYDTSYCHNKHDLKIWAKNAKSKNPRVLEFHALFIGLCKKVEDKDLTTDEAQFIFHQAKIRLFGE